MKFYFLSLLMTLIWLQGCAEPSSGALVLTPDQEKAEPQFNDQNKTASPQASDPARTSDDLSYQNILSHVLEPKCLNCHSEKGGNRGQLNLEGYQNIFNNKDRIRSQIVELKMPKKSAGPLTDDQMKLLINWIDAGAHEFSDKPSTAPVTTAPPLTTTPNSETVPSLPADSAPPVPAVPVIEEPSTPPDLAHLNFDGVMKLVIEPKCLKCHSTNAKNGVELVTYDNLVFNQDDIKKDVTSNEMPKKDELTPDQKKLILDWIKAGSPRQ